VRFRETCLAIVVVIARVRDEVLYTFFAAPVTPLRSLKTLVLANVRQAPRPLRCPLAGTLLLTAAWPLIRIREDLVKDPHLCHWVHSTATWPLSGAHRRLPLHRHLAGMLADPVAVMCRVLVLLDLGVRGVIRCLAPRRCSSSSLSPRLLSRLLCAFFKESVALIHSKRRRGRLNIHFAPFDFYKSHLTIRLNQKICENVKIIMIYIKYII
jgi:hypothetical protein